MVTQNQGKKPILSNFNGLRMVTLFWLVPMSFKYILFHIHEYNIHIIELTNKLTIPCFIKSSKDRYSLKRLFIKIRGFLCVFRQNI